MWRRSPVRGFSASTRTPTSIEVRQTALTVAEQIRSSPMLTGWMKVIRSIAAVTTRVPRVADRGDPGDLVAEPHHHAAVDESRPSWRHRCPST